MRKIVHLGILLFVAIAVGFFVFALSVARFETWLALGLGISTVAAVFVLGNALVLDGGHLENFFDGLGSDSTWDDDDFSHFGHDDHDDHDDTCDFDTDFDCDDDD